jgi:hypothetical protein
MHDHGPNRGSILVLRKECQGWKGYSTASNDFKFNDLDGVRMQYLWHWGQNYIMQTSIIKPEHYFKIGDVPSMNIDGTSGTIEDKDAIVMVVGAYPNPHFSTTGPMFYGFLRIWDGTGDESDQ